MQRGGRGPLTNAEKAAIMNRLQQGTSARSEAKKVRLEVTLDRATSSRPSRRVAEPKTGGASVFRSRTPTKHRTSQGGVYYSKPSPMPSPLPSPGLRKGRKRSNSDSESRSAHSEIRLWEKAVDDLEYSDITNDKARSKQLQLLLASVAERCSKIPPTEAADSERLEIVAGRKLARNLARLYKESCGSDDDEIMYLNEFVCRILYCVAMVKPAVTCPAIAQGMAEELDLVGDRVIMSDMAAEAEAQDDAKLDPQGEESLAVVLGTHLADGVSNLQEHEAFMAKQKKKNRKKWKALSELEKLRKLLKLNKRKCDPRVLLLSQLLMFCKPKVLGMSYSNVETAMKNILLCLEKCQARSDGDTKDLMQRSVKALLLLNHQPTVSGSMLVTLAPQAQLEVFFSQAVALLRKISRKNMPAPGTPEYRMYTAILKFLTQFFDHVSADGKSYHIGLIFAILDKHITHTLLGRPALVLLLKCAKSVFRLPRESWDFASSRPQLERIHATIAILDPVIEGLVESKSQEVHRGHLQVVQQQIKVMLPLVRETLAQPPVAGQTLMLPPLSGSRSTTVVSQGSEMSLPPLPQLGPPTPSTQSQTQFFTSDLPPLPDVPTWAPSLAATPDATPSVSVASTPRASVVVSMPSSSPPRHKRTISAVSAQAVLEAGGASILQMTLAQLKPAAAARQPATGAPAIQRHPSNADEDPSLAGLSGLRKSLSFFEKRASADTSRVSGNGTRVQRVPSDIPEPPPSPPEEAEPRPHGISFSDLPPPPPGSPPTSGGLL